MVGDLVVEVLEEGAGIHGPRTVGRAGGGLGRDSGGGTMGRPMPHVLVVAYGGGHINALLPVIDRLRTRPGWQVTVLALTTAAATCAARNVPIIGLRDLPVQDDASRRHGERLAAALPPNPNVPREESVAYLGCSYRDLEAAEGVAGASARYAAEGRAAFLPIPTFTAVLDHLRPDLVLSTSAPRAERAVLAAAGLRGVPSVCVVDLFALSEEAWVGQPGFATRVCVPMEIVRQRLVSLGRQPDEVVVTGNPVFDRLGDPALRQRAADLRRQRGWEGRQVVLWASQPEPQDPTLPRRVEAALVAAMAANPARLLLIRPHPNDQYDLPPIGPQVAHSTRADDLAATLAAADTVVTMTSTVGLEAALLGRPVVTFDGSINTPFAPYSRMGISRGALTLDALAPALDDALAGTGPSPDLPAPGGATDAVLRVIDGLL